MADILTPQDPFILQELARQRDANLSQEVPNMNNGQDLNTQTNAPEQRTLGLGNSATAQQSGIGLSSTDSTMGQGRKFSILERIFNGLDAMGGGTPLYLQQQQLDVHRQDLAQQHQLRRDALDQQLKVQEENKRQHDMGMIEKIIAGPQEGSVKQKMLEQLGLPQSRALAKAMKDADYENFPLYKEYIPTDVQRKFASGELKPAEIHSWIDLSREAVKADTKERAKATLVQHALDTPEAQRTPYHKQLVQERQAALENKKMDTELKQSQIDENKAKAQAGGMAPVRNDMTDIPSIATFGTAFASIPDTARVTQQHLDNARAAHFDISGLQVGMPARSAAAMLGIQQAGKIGQAQGFGRGVGQGDVPVGVEANLYTKLLPDGTMQGIQDPGMGKIDAGKQGYRDTARFKTNLDMADKARSALRLIGDLETYAKVIVKAQGPVSAVVQGWTLGLEGITKAGALTDYAPNGKRLTVGEVANLYHAKSEQIADQLARGGGMVGTATELDTKRSLLGLAGTYDTANVAEEKYRTFRKSFGTNLLQEYDRAYGREGVPATLRQRLTKGELPSQSKIPARQFLEQQHKSYQDMGYSDPEIKDLLKRDFIEMGYD